jgi:hypothetical protein
VRDRRGTPSPHEWLWGAIGIAVLALILGSAIL